MSLSHAYELLLRGLEGTSDPNSLRYISREAAYLELRQRTGQDFGYDIEKWREYVRLHAGELESEKLQQF
jgi:hypothetical protein